MADKAGVLVLTGSRHTRIGTPGAEGEAVGPGTDTGVCFFARWFPSLFAHKHKQMKMANTSTRSVRVMDAPQLHVARGMGISYSLM